MQVNSLVKASAQVIRITEVTEGDIYKRYDKPSYGEARMLFGVVTDVLHNGEDAAIVSVEFVPEGYGTAYEPRIKTFGADAEVMLFPASLDEFQVGMGEAITAQQRVVEAAERDAANKRSVLERMRTLRESALSVPATTAIEA
jgi:hypothetical protein